MDTAWQELCQDLKSNFNMKYSQKKRFVLKIKSDRTAVLLLALTLQTLVRCDNEKVEAKIKEICKDLRNKNTSELIKVCHQLIKLSKIETLKFNFLTH